MQRGPRACGSGQIMSLKENAEALLHPGPTLLTQKCVFSWHCSHLESWSDLVGETGEAVKYAPFLALFLCVTKDLCYFYCLIWDWRGKNLAGVLSLRLQTRNEQNRGWELEWKGTRTSAGIQTHKHSSTRTRVRTSIYFDTHVWENVARSHSQCCYMQCKHVWGCVLNTHYRGLGKLWERLGEKTNKPHRVTGRGW